MQLNIYELNENDAEGTENNELIESSFEQIPENIVPIKKKVTKSILKNPIQNQNQIQKPIQIQIQKPIQKPKISYEDILSKMGMFVSDGKLHLVDRNSVSFQEEQNQEQVINQIPQNSYIHNKYFKNDLQPQNTITRPKTAQEYKKMIIENYIERLRIKQIKSRKLLMPTSNISMATGNSSNLNRFFRLN